MLRRPKQKIHLKITDHVDAKELKEFLVTQMKTPEVMEIAGKDAMTHENLCTTMALQFHMGRLLSDIGPVSDLELLEITHTNVVAINAHLGREPGPAVDTEYFDFDDYRACLAVSKSWKAKFGMKGAMA
ncbi:uncharacterized protein FSUBG_11967 [Fusarium subglutinans]|uniref:Uncharacterized protein n=1 Tax=Gibberella subglutinans TaxID=42677 RepID=A0A8H5P5B0_GIBSU|nr:uncharacterized protein FSUBG_11967 [Fusarium subglutinans]KAF5586960.1 hypothetical protein FSUBG_11967 [Fusarium subglutinans]